MHLQIKTANISLPSWRFLFCYTAVMSDIEVLVLNGSPGSGKSTMANAVSEVLREASQTHAVIDIDELGRVYPENHDNLMWNNLAAVWQNYMQTPGIKVILPVCIDDKEVLDKLKAAVHCDTFTICELTAPTSVLEARVTEREPNEYWQKKLRGQIQVYESRTEKFADFQVSTENLTPEQTAQEIIQQLGWLSN
jgi:adenylylsulfate kinase-like enzyme